MSFKTRSLYFVAMLSTHLDLMNSCDIERREREEKRAPDRCTDVSLEHIWLYQLEPYILLLYINDFTEHQQTPAKATL